MTPSTSNPFSSPRKPAPLWLRAARVLLALGIVTSALVAWLNVRGEASLDLNAPATPTATPAQLAQGAYLARAGNCAACHTARGGADYAGGLGIATPFGTVYTSNLTPDASTGLGNWTQVAFWRAMHHGRSADGHLLYPVFPYTSYTNISRSDSDALYAYLRSLAPVAQANRPHELAFPYSNQASLAVWRALSIGVIGLLMGWDFADNARRTHNHILHTRTVFRWAAYYALGFGIMLSLAYGLTAQEFIYFQF